MLARIGQHCESDVRLGAVPSILGRCLRERGAGVVVQSPGMR
jgi:hypothetical protein